MGKLTVFLVDDHAIFTDSLQVLLEMRAGCKVVGKARDCTSAIEAVKQCQPDLVLMDLSMPDSSGIEATRQICAKLPQAKIIMVSSISTRSYVQRSIKAGARGYVLKENMISEVVTAIRRVMKGQTYFGTGIRGRMEIESQVIDGNNVPLA